MEEIAHLLHASIPHIKQSVLLHKQLYNWTWHGALLHRHHFQLSSITPARHQPTQLCNWPTNGTRRNLFLPETKSQDKLVKYTVLAIHAANPPFQKLLSAKREKSYKYIIIIFLVIKNFRCKIYCSSSCSERPSFNQSRCTALIIPCCTPPYSSSGVTQLQKNKRNEEGEKKQNTLSTSAEKLHCPLRRRWRRQRWWREARCWSRPRSFTSYVISRRQKQQ